MKIFNAQQIYEADKFTIEEQQITSESLMERAALQLFNWLHSRMQGAPVKIHLFCGIGNNGGDGIALARHLQEHGYHIDVNVVNYSEKRSQDFLINLERLKARKIWPNFINEDSPLPQIGVDDIIVDAIFGIGLNRPPSSWVAKLIDYLNNTGTFILSVDVPSGLFLERAAKDTVGIIKADFVLSFQAPKLVFFLPQTGPYCKQWEVLDIGLDTQFLNKADVTFQLVTKQQAKGIYKPRPKFSHKGSYGHALILGGSFGKIGAVILAAKACLSTGSGLVTAYVPECGNLPLQTAVPEAMVITDKDDRAIADIKFEIKPSVIGLGIGLGTAVKTANSFSSFLTENKAPLVVDADGLNLLAKKKTLLKKLAPHSVLTPHPKEFERLVGAWKDDFEKLEKAKKFTEEYHCILVLKGAHTITFHEGKGFINNTGNPGMATAGSGDVLTGMITGLVACGYKPFQAAILGVYLHGRAGDIAALSEGQDSVTAGKIIEAIGSSYLELLKPPDQPVQAEDQ